MPSMKAIKRRIASVSSTQQIMKAMDLVAASKLQKVKGRLEDIRPIFRESNRIMDAVRHSEETIHNDFVSRHGLIGNSLYIVITSDRGLCGSYNTNVAKVAVEAMKGKNEKVIAIGKRGYEFVRRRGKDIVRQYPGATEATTIADAEKISVKMTEMYINGEIDEAYVVFTKFESMLSHVPHIEKVLPIGRAEKKERTEHMEYEPDVHTFIEHAVPVYLNVYLFGAMIEANVCEQAARMMSMEAASNNAEEIIEDLTLIYNRERQGMITQELNEIVGGANALQ